MTIYSLPLSVRLLINGEWVGQLAETFNREVDDLTFNFASLEMGEQQKIEFASQFFFKGSWHGSIVPQEEEEEEEEEARVQGTYICAE
ncbi:hypothetical protein OUZ56_000437 [Daphnia magna]|uniref:Galectin n=1 Tax=Daphnia magna TaxID=35525 RepID=A0ABQ9ZZN3_9CRUS|nr:hypothetical protein OUZ56_000437 [Daphnia magna]